MSGTAGGSSSSGKPQQGPITGGLGPLRTAEEAAAYRAAEAVRLGNLARRFEMDQWDLVEHGADAAGAWMRLAVYALAEQDGRYAQLAVPVAGHVALRIISRWHHLGYAVRITASYTDDFVQLTLWRRGTERPTRAEALARQRAWELWERQVRARRTRETLADRGGVAGGMDGLAG